MYSDDSDRGTGPTAALVRLEYCNISEWEENEECISGLYQTNIYGLYLQHVLLGEKRGASYSGEAAECTPRS